MRKRKTFKEKFQVRAEAIDAVQKALSDFFDALLTARKPPAPKDNAWLRKHLTIGNLKEV